jgi:hypothetical protein
VPTDVRLCGVMTVFFVDNLRTVFCGFNCFLNIVPPEDDALKHGSLTFTCSRVTF